MREHHRPSPFRSLQQHLCRRLPCLRLLLACRQRRDVFAGIAERDQLAAIGQRDRVVETFRPAQCRQPFLSASTLKPLGIFDGSLALHKDESFPAPWTENSCSAPTATVSFARVLKSQTPRRGTGKCGSLNARIAASSFGMIEGFLWQLLRGKQYGAPPQSSHLRQAHRQSRARRWAFRGGWRGAYFWGDQVAPQTTAPTTQSRTCSKGSQRSPSHHVDGGSLAEILLVRSATRHARL